MKKSTSTTEKKLSKTYVRYQYAPNAIRIYKPSISAILKMNKIHLEFSFEDKMV